MNPDRRTGISPTTEIVTNRRGAHIPRWARVPQKLRMAGAVAEFSVRLLYSVLLAKAGATTIDIAQKFSQTPATISVSDTLLGISIAEAAGPKCTGTVEVLGFKYADRFDIDGTERKDNIDPTDYDLGNGDFHGVNLLNKDKKPFNPPKKENMIPQGNYSRATFRITPGDNLDCTTATSLELYVQFERDEKVIYRVILPNGQKIFHVGGKKEDDEGALERIARGDRPVQQVRTSTEQIAKALTGHTLGLVSPADMAADNSDQNKKAIKDYVGKVKTKAPSPDKSGSGANREKKQGEVPVVPIASGLGLTGLAGLAALIYRASSKVPHWNRWGHKII